MMNGLLAKRREQVKHGNKLRTVYIFNCCYVGCQREIRLRSDALKESKGLCRTHVQTKKPFESIFNSFKQDHRGLSNTITYEQFLRFTQIKNCYYCGERIPWTAFSTKAGEFSSRAYFLDRKINNEGYSVENCVVCCTLCNKFKNTLDHNDFIVLCSKIHSVYMSNILKSVNFDKIFNGDSCGS